MQYYGMIIQIFFIFIIILVLLQIINFFAFINISNPKNYKHYNNIIKNDNYLDKMYDNVIKIKSTPRNTGMYYDELSSSSLFSIGGTHNAGCYRKNIFNSPCEFDYIMSGLIERKNDKLIILDAGCGIGGMSFYLLNNMPNIKVVSITNSTLQRDIVNKQILDQKLQNRMTVHVIDFDNLSNHFNNNTFDYVLFLETHGYSKDRPKLFDQVYNILKPNGKIYIKTPAFRNTSNKSIKKIQYDVLKFWRYNHSTKEEIMNDLLKSKFIDIKYKTISGKMSFVAVNSIDILKGTLFILCKLNFTANPVMSNIVAAFHNIEELIIIATKNN